MKKKSQITLYVILGILVLALVGVGAYYFSNSARQIIFSEQRQDSFSDITRDTISSVMDNCVRDFVLDSIDNYGFCDKEDEYELEISENLSECMDFDYFRDKNYAVTASDHPETVDVDINEDRILVYVKYPIQMTKSGNSINFEQRTFTLPLENTISVKLDSESRATKDYVLISNDNDMELEIPRGTKITSSSGNPNEISVRITGICPHDPGVLGKVKYVFTPETLSFEPDAYLSIKYEDSDVSKHAAEEKFKLAFINENYWQKIESSANTEKNFVKVYQT